MQPLDPGQRRELEYLLAQPGSGVHLSFLRRALTAFCLAAVGGSVFGSFVALADGPWLLLGLLLSPCIAYACSRVFLLLPELPNGGSGSLCRVTSR